MEKRKVNTPRKVVDNNNLAKRFVNMALRRGGDRLQGGSEEKWSGDTLVRTLRGGMQETQFEPFDGLALDRYTKCKRKEEIVVSIFLT